MTLQPNKVVGDQIAASEWNTLVTTANLALTTAQSVTGLVNNTVTGTLGGKYITAGILSENGSGAYVQDGGGVYLGGPTGVWLRQEGFSASYELGSWAAYPLVANRWCGLSLAPSGSPWNLPTQNVTSLALQLQNGASEERLTISAKWFGDQATGTGEYRIAPYKNGSGVFRVLTIANADHWLQKFNTDSTVTFTNETFAGGVAGGNTVVNIANPATTGSFRLVARSSDGLVGFERLTSGTADWMMQYRATGEWLVGAQPARLWSENDQTTDNQNWVMDASGGVLRIMAANGALNTFGNVLTADRSGATIGTVTLGGAIKLAAVPPNFANDAAAATGSVPVGGVYRNGSVLMVRVS